MDSIDRQAAISEFDCVKVDEENCTEYDIGYNDGIDFAVSRLSVLPSAQPEIIQCKECKHYKTMFCAMDTWTEDVTIYKARPDDFCSRAERRQGASNR